MDERSLPAGDGPQTIRSPLQQRVAAAILDAAARLFAAGDERSSMGEVAEVAGVGRATVYRYFPNRQALLAELGAHAVTEVEERLRAARIDAVAADEGVRRAIRALIEAGDLIVVLKRAPARPAGDDVSGAVTEPLRALFERGQSSGVIRGDVPASWLADLLVSQVVTALSSEPRLGNDDATAVVTSLLLEGSGANGNGTG